MEAKAIYNGVDLSRWAKENGIVQNTVFRASRSVITLSGSLIKRQIPKRTVSIRLLEIRDSTLLSIAPAIVPLGTFEYTDRDVGDRTAQFYAHISTGTEKTVRGGITYWSGVTIELEEA